jgi:nitroreductase
MKTIPVPDILARRSVRRYTNQPVSAEQITALLEAGMAAPSASNRQPWHFVVIADPGALNRLADAHPYAKMLYQAPLCIAVCGDTTISEHYWVQDCSAATENILLAAAGMGLGGVWLGVHPRAEREQTVREILGLPAHVTPLGLISLGYPAETPAPRTQYQAERVHHEKW